ncbi:hypothetical protein [Pseudomonas sp. GL-R-19]|uniref:hypothetical protein n=1 Tax=Pseudomonas sp. GL-R-19 TaxID=2832391 RepID=UPI001CBFF086|nr:hypothetical protein [Pseudomonas sp. GL-R-19]
MSSHFILRRRTLLPPYAKEFGRSLSGFFGLIWVAARQKSAGQSKKHSNNPKEQPDTDNPPGKDGIRQ